VAKEEYRSLEVQEFRRREKLERTGVLATVREQGSQVLNILNF
jgi:hypothetical protein